MRWQRATLEMWVPTSSTLTQLAYVASIDDIREGLSPGPLGDVDVEDVAADIVRIRMPAGGGVAGQPIDSYLVGRQRFVLVDPGDPTGDGLDRAVEEAERRGGTIEAIALTCAEPDHAGGAESIREQLGIMVFGGPYASNHVPYVITELNDGSIIDEGDVPLRLAWTPGLERASSALVVGDGQFVIAGDLDGVRGRRSIFGPVDEEQVRSSVARLRSAGTQRSVARWTSRPRLRLVTEPSSVKPFPDARPPHLPDTLTRQSRWQLFFVVIVVLQSWRLVQAWQPSVVPGDAKSAVEYVLSWIPSMTAPLIGVALFYRHPDARRSLRILVFGVILLSIGELLSAFQDPIREFLRGLTPVDDPSLLAETPAEFAFRVFTLLLTIFGLLYVGAGLSDRAPSRGDEGRTPAHGLARGARGRGVARQPDGAYGAARRIVTPADRPGAHRCRAQRRRHLRLGVSRRRDDQRLDRPGDAASSVGRGRSCDVDPLRVPADLPGAQPRAIRAGFPTVPRTARLHLLDGVGAAHRRLRSRTADAGGLY